MDASIQHYYVPLFANRDGECFGGDVRKFQSIL